MAALLQQVLPKPPAQTPSPSAPAPVASAADPNADAKSKGFATSKERDAWLKANARKTTTTPTDFGDRGRGFSPGMRTIFSAMFGDKERLG